MGIKMGACVAFMKRYIIEYKTLFSTTALTEYKV